jgi:hypothetical protein
MRFISLACILIFWCASAIAAPISVDIDRNVNLSLGTRNFGPIAVPDAVTVMQSQYRPVAMDKSRGGPLRAT